MLSAFTLITIGAFNENQWMVTAGIGVITFIIGDKQVAPAVIKKLKEKE